MLYDDRVLFVGRGVLMMFYVGKWADDTMA